MWPASPTDILQESIFHNFAVEVETITSSVSDVVFIAQWTLVQGTVLRPHVVRLSVPPSARLSVTLVDCDHIGWTSWKLIARTISPTPSLFVAKKRSTYSQGNMGEFRGY